MDKVFWKAVAQSRALQGITAVQQATKSTGSLSSRVKAKLGGVKSVTISAPGILLHQWTTQELQVEDLALLKLLREIC